MLKVICLIDLSTPLLPSPLSLPYALCSMLYALCPLLIQQSQTLQGCVADPHYIPAGMRCDMTATA
jgi:hypothetical protein